MYGLYKQAIVGDNTTREGAQHLCLCRAAARPQPRAPAVLLASAAAAGLSPQSASLSSFHRSNILCSSSPSLINEHHRHPNQRSQARPPGPQGPQEVGGVDQQEGCARLPAIPSALPPSLRPSAPRALCTPRGCLRCRLCLAPPVVAHSSPSPATQHSTIHNTPPHTPPPPTTHTIAQASPRRTR